jgi:uncharacterized protein involved in propanediol utilization
VYGQTALSRSSADGAAQILVGAGVVDGVLVGMGRGVATAHHGELFQGQVRDSAGTLRRCLVSLPCMSLYSWVTFQPDASSVLSIDPARKSKTRAAIELTLDYLGAPAVGGLVTIVSNIEEGKGYGSSTADCVAAVRAIAQAFGQRLADDEIARLVVGAEIASDNTMFDHAVLFAQREGVVLEDYGKAVPRLDVLGIDSDRRGIVDTLTYPPAPYSRDELELFQTLLGAVRRAMRTQDAVLLGRVATASAAVNQRFLPKPLFPEIRRIAELAGAVGVAVAHSGTVLGILFDSADASTPRALDLARRQLSEIGVSDPVHFQSRPSCLKAARP